MALHGTLDEFPLEGVLELLDRSGSTGVLHIEASDREASVWVRQGTCLWAQTDLRRDGLAPSDAMVDAVFELSLLRAGLFRFHSCARDELRPPDSAARKLRDILEQVAEQRTAWARTLSELPDLDQVVELTPGDPPGDVVIRPAEWRVLSRIERGRSLRQLLASGDGLWRTGEVVTALIGAGLIRVGDRTVEEQPVARGRPAGPSPLVDEIALLGMERAESEDEPVEAVDEPDLVLVTVEPEEAEQDEGDDPDEVRRLAGEVLRDLSWEQEVAETGGRAHRGRIIRLLSGER